MTALISLSLARHITTINREWDTSSIWFAAVTLAILFFISLLAHELSHVLLARGRNLPVSGVTLFALGGLAHIDKPARRASDELLVAIVGPVASLAIGFICLGAATAMDWSPRGGSARFVPVILGWSGLINAAVAVFNLLPAYPLDGGRILRSVLCASGTGRRRNRDRSGPLACLLWS
jgi:Zn-dependent protease